ncbi:hypothetical protein B0H11DRAFT_2282541 [Mycena galericulata]|nr:hypothetical protein B0H11DRAFT_2282541 [Mycena galericulata]
MRFAQANTVLLCLVLLFHLTIMSSATPRGPTATEERRPASVPRKETNAERFRRGLGPLPPVRRDRKKPRARPSSTPCTPLSNNVGMLQIRRLSDGDKIGYVSASFNADNAYTLVGSPAGALHLTVPPAALSGEAINLIAADPPDSRNPYFGGVDSGSGALVEGEAGFVYLSGTSGVRGNSPPSSSAGTSLTNSINHGGVESQIWTLDCQTKQVTAQWTNSDNSHPPTITIFYDPVLDFLGLTADLQALNSAHSDEAYGVVFTFISS